VTVYWLIADPLFAGATQVTRACVFPGDAAGFAGAAGTVAAPAGAIANVGTSANAATRTSPNFRPRSRIEIPPDPQLTHPNLTSTDAGPEGFNPRSADLNPE